MEHSSEVMVEEGDVELSLGLSLGGQCKNGGGVSFTAFLKPDPDPVGPKEEDEEVDRGGNTNADGRKKKKHHHHHHYHQHHLQQQKQKQWEDQNKRHNPHYGTLPVMPMMQYTYNPQQCLPYGFPYMVPLWSLPTVSSAGPTQPNNVFQPVPTRSFVPFRAGAGPVIADGRKEGKSAATATIHRVPSFTASQGSSFSAISDFHTLSHQGGSSSSSDSRSNATHVVEEKSQRNSSKSSELQQQHSPSTNSPDKIHPIKVDNAERTDNEHTPDSTKSMATPTIVTKKAEPGLNCTDHEGKSTTSSPAKNDVPAANQVNPIVSNLPEMPCVTTTGNGPNGKKITGFLYRYNKNEVSIVCVCHGSSFSPAEFIKHAGGTEVSHPLRHIVVVPP